MPRERSGPLGLFSHRRIPPRSWQSRCNVCQLWRDLPEAYDYATTALIAGVETQEQIAATLRERWGFHCHPSQLSRHRVRHLLPDLRDAHETWIATLAILEELGNVPPGEMAVRMEQATSLLIYQRIQSGECGDKELASLAQALQAVNDNLRDAERLATQTATAEEQLGLLRLQRAVQEGQYEEALIEFIRERYPQLMPLLAEAASAVQDEADNGKDEG